MNPTDLQTPPTEAEIADIARLPEPVRGVVRRLAFQRDTLLTRVRELEAALAGMVAGYGHNFHTGSVALANARAALAGPIPTPTEAAP